VVWHGTDSPNPEDTEATLKWALINDGKRGSANYYIPQHGIPYHYIDEANWIAYSAGAGGSKCRGYVGYQVNVHSASVEIEERITKKPKIAATSDSLLQAVEIALYLKEKWSIPLDRAYHVGHREIVNPGYRSDPDSYSIDNILSIAKARDASSGQPPTTGLDPRFQAAWQASGGIWQKDELTPGYPAGPAFDWQGHTYQMFERGVARLESSAVSWLLIPEIIALKRATGK
jgi:hypothetical protein